MEEHIAVFEDLPIAAVAWHLDPISIVKLAATCRIAASLSADWQARAAKGIHHRDERLTHTHAHDRLLACSSSAAHTLE